VVVNLRDGDETGVFERVTVRVRVGGYQKLPRGGIGCNWCWPSSLAALHPGARSCCELFSSIQFFYSLMNYVLKNWWTTYDIPCGGRQGKQKSIDYDTIENWYFV